MRTVVIEPISEGIDEKLELIEAVEQVVDGIELVSPGAVAALDRAIPCGVDLDVLTTRLEQAIACRFGAVPTPGWTGRSRASTT